MNKENVNPNWRKFGNKAGQCPKVTKLNKQIRIVDQKIKHVQERSSPNAIIAEIKEVYELITTQDNFIEFLMKSLKGDPRLAQINAEALTALAKALNRQKEIGEWARNGRFEARFGVRQTRQA